MDKKENRQEENSRFSRFFDSRPIDDEALEAIVDAGMFTRGQDRQMLHFTVIKSREEMEKYRAARKAASLPEGVPAEAADQFADPMRNAPVAVLISAKGEGEPCDGGCPVVQRLLSAAALRGVIGSLDRQALTDLFGRQPELKTDYVPEGYELRAVLLLGYPGPIMKDLGERVGTVEYK